MKRSGSYSEVRTSLGAVSQQLPACFQHVCRRCARSDKQVRRNAVKSPLWVISFTLAFSPFPWVCCLVPELCSDPPCMISAETRRSIGSVTLKRINVRFVFLSFRICGVNS